MNSTITQDIKKVIDIGDSLPSKVVIGGLKHVTVVEGKENEFESLFKELAVEVRKHDKRCNYYDLYKSEQSRNYIVMEQYEDKEALQMHQKSEHGQNYFPKLRERIEKMEVSYYVCVAPLNST
jgi:quinol monooxygenase YgiN